MNINFESMCNAFYGYKTDLPADVAALDYIEHLLSEEADRQTKAIKEDPPDDRDTA